MSFESNNRKRLRESVGLSKGGRERGSGGGERVYRDITRS